MGQSPTPKALPDAPVVIVVGGGYGGSSAAKVLDASGLFNVLLLSRTDYAYLTYAGLRVVVDPSFQAKTTIPYDKLMVHGNFLHGEVAEMTPTEVRVHGLPQALTFDHLVIATGNAYAFPTSQSPPTKEQMHSALQDSHTSAKEAKRILVVGGGALGCELAGELATAFPSKQITLVQSGESLLSTEGSPKLAAAVQEALTKLKVKLLLGQRVDVAELKSQSQGGPVQFATTPDATYTTTKGEEIKADLVFLCLGGRVNSQSYATGFESSVDERGHLLVKPGTFEVGEYNNVFAIGDCSTAETVGRGYFAVQQGDTLAKQMITREKARLAKIKAPKVSPYKATETKPTIITLGPNNGLGQLPNGWMMPGFVTALKNGDLFASKTWPDWNQSKAGVPETRKSAPEHLANLQSALKLPAGTDLQETIAAVRAAIPAWNTDERTHT